MYCYICLYRDSDQRKFFILLMAPTTKQHSADRACRDRGTPAGIEVETATSGTTTTEPGAGEKAALKYTCLSSIPEDFDGEIVHF